MSGARPVTEEAKELKRHGRRLLVRRFRLAPSGYWLLDAWEEFPAEDRTGARILRTRNRWWKQLGRKETEKLVKGVFPSAEPKGWSRNHEALYEEPVR